MYLLPHGFGLNSHSKHQDSNMDSTRDERLRGWAWQYPPLAPPIPIKIQITDITERDCATNRDMFNKYIMGIKTPRTQKVLENQVFYTVVTGAYNLAKQIIYTKGVISGNELVKIISNAREKVFTDAEPLPWPAEFRNKGIRRMTKLWEKTLQQIQTAVDNVLERQPSISPDGLVNAALPIVLNQHLSAPNIGIAGPLNANMYLPKSAIIDIRTDKRRRFHRLAVVASAIVTESIYESPMDVGCIIYCRFDREDEPIIEYDTFEIDDDLRRELVELRDKIMKIVKDGRDPGLADVCHQDCPYYHICHGAMPKI